MEINYNALQSATVTVTATDDDYQYSASATFSGAQVTNIGDGQVKKDDRQVATFNQWSDEGLNISFLAAENKEVTLTERIKEFLASVRTEVPTYSFTKN